MARLVSGNAFDMDLLIAEGTLWEFFYEADVTTHTASNWSSRWTYEEGSATVTEDLLLTGTFGNYDGDYPTTGTVTGATYRLNGVTLFTITSMSISVEDFTAYVNNDDMLGLFEQILAGNDELIGSGGDDILFGFNGNDLMDGRAGSDELYGMAGNDTYVVTEAGDFIFEDFNQGSDTVRTNLSTYTLLANFEHLTYTGTAAFTGLGNALNNVLRGGAGADLLNGYAGSDTMYGGAGNDRYVVGTSGDVAVEGASAGTDLVYAYVSHALGTNLENLTLLGTATINGYGNTVANTLIGNAANNILDGRAGADTMRGGAGNDAYIVDNVGDRTIEFSAQGTDLVRSSVSFTLANQVENLTLTGTTAIYGYGNALANVIIGTTTGNVLNGYGGIDRLNGGAGNDHLYGGTASDWLTGGTGLDRFVFDTALSASSNVDRIVDFSVADDTIALDRTIFTALTTTGTLSTAAFRAGTAAADSSDRIIYDAATGRIYYDADGNGAGAQVLFAQVNAGLPLTNADFLIVA